MHYLLRRLIPNIEVVIACRDQTHLNVAVSLVQKLVDDVGPRPYLGVMDLNFFDHARCVRVCVFWDAIGA